MRKIIYIILLLMTPLAAAWSQVSFGIKAGVNIANQAYKSSGISISPSSLAGFHGGVYLNAKFGKFGLQPEAYFSMAGAKFDNDKVNFNYISVPILFRYNVTDFLNLHLGPQFGILVSAKSTSGSITADIKDQANTLDFGVAGGIGLDLPFGLSAGLRYVAGLANIQKDTSGGETVKNNIFQIYVGYKLFGK